MVIEFQQPEFDLNPEAEKDESSAQKEAVGKRVPSVEVVRSGTNRGIAPLPNPETLDREPDPGDYAAGYRKSPYRNRR